MKYRILPLALLVALFAGTASAQSHSSHKPQPGATGFSFSTNVSVSIMTVNGSTVVHRSSGGTPAGTTTITTNGGVVVYTSVFTNGGAFGTTSFGGSPLDPQAILKALQAGGPHGLHQRMQGGVNGSPFATLIELDDGGDTNPVTWLGVSTEEVSGDLRAQLPIPNGAGLIVRDVVKDSPAEKAGLRVNDVLLRLDDQLLINTHQFQTLIGGRNEGDEIGLTLLRKGQETKVRAKLVKHAPDLSEAAPADAPGVPADFAKVFDQAGLPEEMKKALDEAMKGMTGPGGALKPK